MRNETILFPVCAQVLLTFIVYWSLGISRVKAILRARVKAQVLVDPKRFDEIMNGLENLSDNFENLFEMPVVFYVAAILIFVLRLTDSFYLIAAWGFVLLRYMHSYIHCTYNRVRHRFYVYLFSSLFVWAIWFRIAYQLLMR